MSKKANPISIALFVILGLFLAISGVVLFSARSLFHPHQKHILYFDTSLKGLNPGAPVKFRGVTIGSVVEVMIRHNQSSNDFSMPVLVSLDKKLAQAKSDELLPIGDKTRLDQLIRQGFRARLDAESLVTGVLYVGLDIVPNAPPPRLHQLTPQYQEIPTLPSDIQQLLANLAQVDIRGLSEKLNTLLARLDSSLGQLNFTEINAGVTNLLRSANQVLTTPDLTNSFASLNRALTQAEVLLKRVDGRVDPLADSATNTLFEAQKTLVDLRVAVRNVADLLSPDSPVPPDLAQVLEEFSRAGRAIADLASFLERDPNAVLVGKRIPKDQR
jgi:paraquat-inducible protein B